MNITIATGSAYAKACRFQNLCEKKTNIVQNVKTNDVNLTKLPNYCYQPVFKGAAFYPINSKRSHIDYGEKLYIGAYGPNAKYSVIRNRADASEKDLSGKDLSNYSFEKSFFINANLNGCRLENVDFQGSNMTGCELKGIETKSTRFSNTNLCNADFKGAKFGRNTNMIGANLMGADLRETDLTYVNLKNALYNETTRFPENMDPEDLEGMIFLTDGADFSNKENVGFDYAKLRYLRIAGAKFDNCSFASADLKKVWATDCSFKNISLYRAYAKEMSLENCDLSGSYMAKSNFDQAEFTNVNMQNANLCGAIFTFKSAENLDLKGAKYDKDTVFNCGFDPKEHGMELYKDFGFGKR